MIKPNTNYDFLIAQFVRYTDAWYLGFLSTDCPRELERHFTEDFLYVIPEMKDEIEIFGEYVRYNYERIIKLINDLECSSPSVRRINL